jgi:LacI family sucrose operon transcriptional repressor
MAGIKDVAKSAGVGVGTVSRFLNNSGYVAKETRERIEQAVAKLDFTPNQLARNFGKLKNSLVAVIVPDNAHPFFAEFIRCAEMELYLRGYKAVVCNTIQKSDREREFLGMLRRSAVDGIITGSHSLDIEEYLQVKAPIVTLDRRLGPGIPVVYSDHKKGGRLAAQKLLESGCRRIAQFTDDNLVTIPARDRHTVFAETIRAAGLEVYNIQNLWNRFDFPYHLEQVNKLFNEYPDVDGIFGVDLIACAALKIAFQKKIPVPEKLKIVGYDGTYVSNLMPKTITTVMQPIADLAAYTVNAVIDRIEGRQVLKDEIFLDVYLRNGETA